MKKLIYWLASIFIVLSIILVALEILGLRINFRYFQKCQDEGRYGRITCEVISKNLFVPKR